MMDTVVFANKGFLYLLLLLPLFVIVYVLLNRWRKPKVIMPSMNNFEGYKPTLRQRIKHLPFVLWLLACAAIIVALARPQSSSGGQNINTEGVDIVMALDISPSMLAEDLRPNRIEAAKKVAVDFIDSRVNDRIGLVVFAGESFTQCPITSDHAVLKNLFSGIESGMLTDGTAIGEGLATAVNRIKTSKAKSKVIILLTDGVNNVGEISPQTAGDIAKAFNIRVYTIGVGTHGMAPYPFNTPFGIQYQQVPVDIDEHTLKGISAETGGKYFRATRTAELKNIYAEIDKLEKTRIEVTSYRHKKEEFYPFIMLALLLLALERLLQYTLLKILP
ncbi:MAG: VWA domain-containing protein [Bacteroidia bacterium]|nr:VWA domain-containing protein [Bacteroidia bacterium]